MKGLITFIGLFQCIYFSAQQPFYYSLNGDTIQLDTLSLEGVEDFGWKDFVINLGNHGSPEINLTPSLSDFITNDYTVLAHQRKHVFKKYHVIKPVVDAKYIVGSGQEQHFNLLHTQNISKNVNYSIGLDKINSNGLYQNQSTNFTDIYFNIYGDQLGKGRYAFDVKFNHINAAASLNGGLQDDSSFINDELELQNRELFDVNLLNAYQEKKLWFGEFDQQLTLYDNRDSLGKGTAWKIINKLSYEYMGRSFYDSLLNEDYYDWILSDSAITNEGNSFQRLGGYLGLGQQSKGKHEIQWSAGANVFYNRYIQEDIDTTLLGLDTNRLDIEGVVSAYYSVKKLKVAAKLRYLLNDSYTNKDYNGQVSGTYQLSDQLLLNAMVYVSNERPQLDLTKYVSNNVTWDNSFKKYQLQHINLGASYSGKWKASVAFNYCDIRNPIYFGYDKTPYQADGVAQLIRTSATVTNTKNKRWDLGAEVHYQYLGGYNIFRVPNVLSKLSAAFKFKAFKKKMAASLGAEIIYFSKYQTKSFNPVTGQFYIYSDQEVGNYPFANVFIKSRVQRATFFLMMSHPHQGLLGNNYFYFPGYPANDRFFRIGVSWMFVN